MFFLPRRLVLIPPVRSLELVQHGFIDQPSGLQCAYRGENGQERGCYGDVPCPRGSALLLRPLLTLLLELIDGLLELLGFNLNFFGHGIAASDLESKRRLASVEAQSVP